MTDDRFARRLPDLMHELAGNDEYYLEDVLAHTVGTRQRPAWTFPGRWLPKLDVLEQLSAYRNQLVVALLLVALLMALLATAVFLGGQRPVGERSSYEAVFLRLEVVDDSPSVLVSSVNSKGVARQLAKLPGAWITYSPLSGERWDVDKYLAPAGYMSTSGLLAIPSDRGESAHIAHWEIYDLRRPEAAAIQVSGVREEFEILSRALWGPGERLAIPYSVLSEPDSLIDARLAFVDGRTGAASLVDVPDDVSAIAQWAPDGSGIFVEGGAEGGSRRLLLTDGTVGENTAAVAAEPICRTRDDSGTEITPSGFQLQQLHADGSQGALSTPGEVDFACFWPDDRTILHNGISRSLGSLPGYALILPGGGTVEIEGSFAGWLDVRRPTLTVAPLDPSASPMPSSTPQPSSTAPDGTPRSSRRVASGSSATAIGNVSWTRLEGDAIPAGDIFETLDGYAAIETDHAGSSSRLWLSSDGLEWALAPLPVAAAGPVGHAVTSGEHWIWSRREFRLWRSTDFTSWTEVDLAGYEAPDVAGISWSFSPNNLAATGGTTLVPWGLVGALALDELLDITLEPGEGLELEYTREAPTLGDVRDVLITGAGLDGTSGVKVGSIRVELAGSIVTVTDADSGEVVARVDSTLVGVPAVTLADNMNWFGLVGRFRGGVVVSNSTARPLEYPLPFMPASIDRAPSDGLVELIAMDGDFVGVTADPDDEEGLLIWASTDGMDWEPLGPPTLPSTDAETVHFDWVLRRPGEDLGQPFVASVLIDAGGGQRRELWSTTDGRRWVGEGVAYTYPQPGLLPFLAPSGGYFATTDLHEVRVSATGDDWARVDGIEGVGASLDEQGGATRIAVTQRAAFITEVPNNGDRVLWLLQVEPEDP